MTFRILQWTIPETQAFSSLNICRCVRSLWRMCASHGSSNMWKTAAPKITKITINTNKQINRTSLVFKFRFFIFNQLRICTTIQRKLNMSSVSATLHTVGRYPLFNCATSSQRWHQNYVISFCRYKDESFTTAALSCLRKLQKLRVRKEHANQSLLVFCRMTPLFSCNYKLGASQKTGSQRVNWVTCIWHQP